MIVNRSNRIVSADENSYEKCSEAKRMQYSVVCKKSYSKHSDYL